MQHNTHVFSALPTAGFPHKKRPSPQTASLNQINYIFFNQNVFDRKLTYYYARNSKKVSFQRKKVEKDLFCASFQMSSRKQNLHNSRMRL